MSAQHPSGGFSLFPNTTAGPPRRSPSRPWRESRGEPSSPAQAHAPHAISTDGHYAAESSASRHGRETPQHQHRDASPESHRHQQHGQDGRQSAMGSRADGPSSSSPVVQRPQQADEVPGRSETAFSQAQTLVRSGSTRSRSSIAKRPFNDEPSSSEEPAPLRSMFPQFNPELPLNRQEYYPTQTSPTHIPMAVISRPIYSPEPETSRSPPAALRSHPVTSTQSTRSANGAAQQQWPPNRPLRRERPESPRTSTQDELRDLWKVANGWKASASEGQVYCLKMAQDKDAPIYTLSSAAQPFYHLRVDPTSASAYIILSRHDPTKAYKAPPPMNGMSSASSILSGRVAHGSTKPTDKNWQETLVTSLEEESRRHRPNDGLVALLAPSAAVKMANDKPDDEAIVFAAERECAKLVWDDDSESHYVVHPALATPFCVTIERMPSWSRVEYTLEHRESPHHLAKLMRDGTGGGYLEIDTGIASKIDSFYLVDVAVCALMIVAAGDERANMETFAPPPSPPRAHLAGGTPRSERFSLTSLGMRGKEAKRQKKRRMEELEMQDVESQDLSFGKPEVARIKNQMSWPARVVWWVVKGVGKAVIWCITAFFKAVLAVLMGVARCFGLTSTYGKK